MELGNSISDQVLDTTTQTMRRRIKNPILPSMGGLVREKIWLSPDMSLQHLIWRVVWDSMKIGFVII